MKQAPTTPLDVDQYVAAFHQFCLPRTLYIHPLTVDPNQVSLDLRTSMGCIGAGYIEGHVLAATELFHEARRLINEAQDKVRGTLSMECSVPLSPADGPLR